MAPPRVERIPVIRWRAHTAGGHVHVRVFAGHVPAVMPPGRSSADYTLGLCGVLTFRDDEWEGLKGKLPGTIIVDNGD